MAKKSKAMSAAEKTLGKKSNNSVKAIAGIHIKPTGGGKHVVTHHHASPEHPDESHLQHVQ